MSRTALTQHQARRNNIADVAAKDGSQVKFVFLPRFSSSIFLWYLIS